MESLNKIALDKTTWLGVFALALTIAAELLVEADGTKGKTDSFVERERARRVKDNLDWLSR